MPGLPLGELLKLPALSRARVLGGDLARQVSWVHVVDLPDPAPWVRPGQLVLTTGYAWPREEGRLLEFATLVAERQPAGVALAVPQFFERFPRVVVEVLGERGFRGRPVCRDSVPALDGSGPRGHPGGQFSHPFPGRTHDQGALPFPHEGVP